MPALLDVRWIGEHGIGRFAKELAARLRAAPYEGAGRPMSPFDPLRLGRFGWSARRDTWLLSPGYNGPLFSKLPYVFTIHDLNHIDRPDNSSTLKRIYYRLVMGRLCRRARAVLTVSEFSKARIVAWFGIPAARVFNVGNGVSGAFTPDGPRHQPGFDYVLCVSNRRGHKNEAGMLRGFALAGLPPEVKLLLTGEETAPLRELARSLSIDARVAFSGRLDESELAAVYRGALFLVFPSFYEGFGLPIVEAFACGVPVITSNVTSMPEIAADAARLVDPTSDREIADAISELHTCAPLRATLAARGLERASSFTWDAVARRVEAAVAASDTDPRHALDWS